MFYELGYPSRFEELRAYYPRFYWGVSEMMAILRSGGNVLDNITEHIEAAYSNCFFATADEPTIARLELFLGIGLNKSRTLEERRRFLISFFSGFGKLSSSTLIEMIKSYTGADVEVTFEPFDQTGNNRLEIAFMRGQEETIYMSDILMLLGKKIPAHIEYRALCTYRYNVEVRCSRTIILSDHEFSGMKPDIILIGDILRAATETVARTAGVIAELTQVSQEAYNLSGKSPETALVGAHTRAAAETDQETQHVIVHHPSASEESGGESGRRPIVTAIGTQDAAHTASGYSAITAQAFHVPCGTICAHQ